jgi:biotin transporter BioY
VEEPILAWTFIITGALIGYFLSQYIRKLSRYTHSAHILISSLAAGLYLVSYGVSFLSLKALLFIPILFVSVLVPCVLNDIGVPSYIVTLTAKSDSNKKKLLHDLHAEHHGHEH